LCDAGFAEGSEKAAGVFLSQCRDFGTILGAKGCDLL
jgi:hypothetical protein